MHEASRLNLLRPCVVLRFLSVCCLWANVCQPQTPEIEGRWKVVERLPKARSLNSHFTFSDGNLEGGLLPSKYSIDASKTPKEIDFTSKHTNLGIYKIEGGKLTICKASVNGRRPYSFDRVLSQKEGWTLTVYENVSEKVDPDVASFLGEWIPDRTANFPFRFVDRVVFSAKRKFENQVRASVLGWPQRKVGAPQELAMIQYRLDSLKNPSELSALVRTKAGTQRIDSNFTGTYEIKKERLKIIMIAADKSGLVRGVPIQWYVELKKR